MMDMVKKVGLPATLEHLAEESAELAAASLKLARIVRGENYTPRTEQEAVNHLAEEMSDVTILLEETMKAHGMDRLFVPYKEYMVFKRARLEKRLNGAQEENME